MSIGNAGLSVERAGFDLIFSLEFVFFGKEDIAMMQYLLYNFEEEAKDEKFSFVLFTE
ncbi:MAG: hypothetical protein RR492_08900 [Enterococcus sp.]